MSELWAIVGGGYVLLYVWKKEKDEIWSRCGTNLLWGGLE